MYKWTENLGRTLGFSVDSYFLVTAMGLASHDSSILARAFFALLFLMALAGGPAAILTSIFTGVLAYYAVLLGDTSSLGLKVIMIAGFAGGICGMAWKLVTPLLLKAVNLLLAAPESDAPKQSSEEAELEAFIKASLKKTNPTADAEALPFVKVAEPATNDNAQNSAAAPGAVAAPMADVEAMRLVLRDKETELFAAQSAKDELAAELEKSRAELLAALSSKEAGASSGERVIALEAELLQARAAQQTAEDASQKLRDELSEAEKEMSKLYGLDAPAQATFAAAASEIGNDAAMAELKQKLSEALAEKDKLAKELEKANDELMKVCGKT